MLPPQADTNDLAIGILCFLYVQGAILAVSLLNLKSRIPLVLNAVVLVAYFKV